MGAVQQNNYLYLAVTCGKMVNKQKGMSISGYRGTLLGIREIEDEYEGQKIVKFEVKIQDDASPEIAIIKFTAEAWYAIGFFARIQKIDPTKPLTIGVLPSDKSEKMSFCYLKQDGIAKVEADKDFPRPEALDLGTKKVQNWAKPIELMRKIMAEVNAKCPQATVPPPPTSAQTDPPNINAFVGAESETDDLPF